MSLIKYTLFITLCISQVGLVKANAVNANFEMGSYKQSVSHVYETALANSKKYQSLYYQVHSSNASLKSVEDYYYPVISLSTDHRGLYGTDTPVPNGSGKVTLKLSSKLYGSAVSDSISAAEYTSKADKLSLKSLKLDIYYKVLTKMSKIERTRLYEAQSALLRAEVEEYLSKQKNATVAGISTKSDLREVELNKIKFEDAVYGGISKIETFFDELRVETGYYSENENDIGVPYEKLSRLIDHIKPNELCEDLIENNYGLIVKSLELNATKYSAEALRERVTVTLTNETFINALDVKGTDAELGSINNDSYLGVFINVDLFQHQAQLGKDAAMFNYSSEGANYEEDKQKIYATFKSKKRSLKSLLVKRQLLLDQIQKSRSLINHQKFEINTDRITFLEISKTLLAFNQLYLSLLSLDMLVYESVYDLHFLVSQKIDLS